MSTMKMTLSVLGVIAVMLTTVGCENGKMPEDRLTIEPYGHTDMHRYYKPMYQEALAHDMSIADCHFFPHTVKLNLLGIRRLERMGPILEKYGGMVRYETASKDEEMVQNRVTSIERYLADAGLDAKMATVEPALSGGRGLPAAAAIRSQENFYNSTLSGEQTNNRGPAEGR